MKITLDLPEIEGYEYTGEYRIAEPMEYFMEELQAARLSEYRTDSEYPILKKKAPKYKTTTVDTGRELFKYVEIKALEHAVNLININNLTPSGLDKLASLKKLLN
jgi:hypothetical protein